MKEKKKIILSVLGIILLVVLIIGITYAAFTYTKKGKVENTVRTGKIIMDYQEAENGITLENAYPIEDSVGKKLSDPNQVFDFTVNINLYGNKLPVSYEVTGEKEENSTLSNEDIRIYLERGIDSTSYSSVLEPSGYIPINSVDEFRASANEMVLDKGTTNDTVTYHYRLRMWVGESYKVTGEEKYFTMKVNVYGNDGVRVEVKGIELDQKSATLKLTNTLQLNAKTSPASPTDTSITWTSSNPKIATVSSSGLVEGKGIGTTTITATSSNGKSATASIKVEADNPNITAATVYNETTCPTGKEDTCEITTCLSDGNCPAGTNVSYKVNDTTIQDFYVLQDNGTTLDLITDKVVATNVQWNSSGNNGGGPITATEALENATSSWTNLPSNTYNRATGHATRARLITLDEVEAVGCKEVISDSCPIWLTNSSIQYWTSTRSSTDSVNAWIVSGHSNRYTYFGGVVYTHGVRAVVTISK